MKPDCLFIHVPKTGGRSILTACGDMPGEHLPLQSYIQSMGKDTVDKMFKFTVVRNPWDRTFSYWRYFVRNTPGFEKYKDKFTQWILDKAMVFNTQAKIPFTPFPGSDHAPWYQAIDEISTTNLQLNHMLWYKNVNGINQMDVFLRFEHLAEDFELVKERIGATLPLGNVGREDFAQSGLESSDYHDYYKHNDAIGFIGELNKELIDRFGYAF